MATFVERREMEKEDDFRNLKKVAVEQLAKLLYMKPATTSELECRAWLIGQERQIKTLNRVLLRSTARSAAQSLINFSQAFEPRPDWATVCAIHSGLNLDLVETLMKLVTYECTAQTDRYRHKRRDENFSLLMGNWLIRIDEISALWMGKSLWEQRMRRALAVELPWSVKTIFGKSSPCAACQLAVVGGSPRFLTDLRANLLARHQYSREVHGDANVPKPCLSGMVDAWISMCYPKDKRIAIADESNMLAGTIFATRVQMRHEREYCEQVGGKRYREPRPADTIATGQPIPRAVGSEEFEREEKRREEGEFLGERDSGWLWSVGQSATTSSQSGSGSRGRFGLERLLGALPSGDRTAQAASQTKVQKPDVPAVTYASVVAGVPPMHSVRKQFTDMFGSGPPRSRVSPAEQRRRDNQQGQRPQTRRGTIAGPSSDVAVPRPNVEVRPPPDSATERFNMFRSWEESFELSNPACTDDKRREILRRDPHASGHGSGSVRMGKESTPVKTEYEYVESPYSSTAELVDPDYASVFTVSPMSIQGAFPAPQPMSGMHSSPYPSANVPQRSESRRSNATAQPLQRGAQNRRAAPSARGASTEAVNGDDEEQEMWATAPEKLERRRLHHEYRSQMPTRRPDLPELTRTLRPGMLTSVEDVASCYEGTGWGGPSGERRD